MAHDNGNGFTVQLLDIFGNPSTFTEFWLAGGQYDQSCGVLGPAAPPVPLDTFGYNTESGAGDLEPNDPEAFDLNIIPYLNISYMATHGTAVHPALGGPGTGEFYATSPYQIVALFTVRSTDADGDGDTDKSDILAMRGTNGVFTSNLNFDFNWDGVVDYADLDIMVAEVSRLHGSPYGYGTSNCDITRHPYNAATSYVDDTVAPSTPSCFRAGFAGLVHTLTWLAGGDDGTVGWAYKYDVRVSTSPINTLADFNAATPLSGVARPLVSGTPQSITYTAPDGAQRYFAILAFDAFGNQSVLVSAASTQITPPAISTLGAGFGHTSSTTSFTLPADACLTNQLAWEVRVAGSPITTDAAWNAAASLATGTDAQGTTHCILQTSLPCNTFYYFAAKYTDRGVLSPLSNSAGGETRCRSSIEVDCGGNHMVRSDDDRDAQDLALLARGANPARSTIGLEYDVPSSVSGAALRLGVYDISGRLVRSLDSGAALAGQHQVTWNLLDDAGQPVARGLYFTRLIVGKEVRTRTIIVNR